MTGYGAGRTSPLRRRGRLRTRVDATALSFATVDVSAGRRALEIEPAPADLVALTGGEA